MSNSAFTPTFAQNLQDASATQKGLVNTTTQVFAGKKTFDGGAAIKGDTSGSAVAAGYIGEKVFASTVNNSSGLSSTSNFNNIQSITLNKGLWLVTSIIDADNAATCTGHFNAISVNTGNTTTDHIRGINQVTTSIPANSSAATCIANYHMTITVDATPVYQKGRAIGAATTCSASIQAIRIA